MIVLDEQLLGRNLEREIRHWYRGAVRPAVRPWLRHIVQGSA